MRMWMISPEFLCRQHLLGEHKEVHMLAGCLRRGKTLGRFLTDRLVDPASLTARHDALVAEMLRRGYRHESPLGDVPDAPANPVDVAANLADLRRRCPACAARIQV